MPIKKNDLIRMRKHTLNVRDHKQKYVLQKKNEIFNKLVESSRYIEHLIKDAYIHTYSDVNDDSKPITSMIFNAEVTETSYIAALAKHLRLVEEYEALS